MTTTSQIRTWWSPACAQIGPVLIPAYRALDACLEAHGYSLRQADTGAYNCRKITGGTGYSLHAYGPGHRFTFWNGVTVTTAVAVDLNWTSNPYGSRLVTDMPPAMVAAIKAIRTRNGRQVWRWGGNYSGNRDAMHFEITCAPADISTGIDPSTVPGATEEDDMAMTPTERQDLIDDIAAAVEVRLLDDFAAQGKGDTARRNTIASLFRRILGVPLMADGSEQHKADEDTGRRFQALLGGDERAGG